MKYKNQDTNSNKSHPFKNKPKKNIFKSKKHSNDLVPVAAHGLAKNFDNRVKAFVNELKKTPESILNRHCL